MYDNLEEKLVKIIQILGMDCHEVCIDIDLDIGTVNSVEWDSFNNIILIHQFTGEVDIEILFTDLLSNDKITIYNVLSQLTYN